MTTLSTLIAVLSATLAALYLRGTLAARTAPADRQRRRLEALPGGTISYEIRTVHADPATGHARYEWHRQVVHPATGYALAQLREHLRSCGQAVRAVTVYDLGGATLAR